MNDGCRRALERLEVYLDGELDDDQYAEIARHLADCWPCGDREHFEKDLREVIRRHATELAPTGLLDKVKARCLGTESA